MTCDVCGQEIPYLLVNGYQFGDRLLEGVDFMVEDKNGRPHALGVVKDAEDYFDKLNKEEWLKNCEAFCEDSDVATCPKCGGEILMPESWSQE